MALITPNWPAPTNVRALTTTRTGGVSQQSFASFNLGAHVGDDPNAVAANRSHLAAELGLSEPLCWLHQVHGCAVHHLAEPPNEPPTADAVVSRKPKQPAIIMTADCLPVLFCDRQGTVVAGAHAGWRSLVDGVLEQTLCAMQCEPSEILVWLGPAISQAHFEVGDEVRAAFIAAQAEAEAAFIPSPAGRWLADLYQLARLRLQRAGVTAIYGGDYCTYAQAELFYSYRRDPHCGRMASLIWLE